MTHHLNMNTTHTLLVTTSRAVNIAELKSVIEGTLIESGYEPDEIDIQIIDGQGLTPRRNWLFEKLRSFMTFRGGY